MRMRVPAFLIAAWWCLPPSAVQAEDSSSESTSPVPGSSSWEEAHATTTSAPTVPSADTALYRIGPGDLIAVRVYGEDSLTGTFPVSPAGEMDFPLVGLVAISGLTTAEVSSLLRDKLMQGYLNKPHVTTSVATYASQPVQVIGAVVQPGLYYLQGPTNVLQLLAIAGGVDSEGVIEVRITRGGEDGETMVLPYERLLSLGTNATALEAGDIVFVPQSLVTVMGKVGKPGDLTFREGLTLSRCIAAMGGPLPTANMRKVFVLRGEERIVVNIRRILDGKDTDLPLQAGDRIIVNQSVF